MKPSQSIHALLVCILLAACEDADRTTVTEPTPVRVEAATAGPALPPIRTTGVVETQDEMRLSFKVGGVIRAIHVREGEAVKRGQLLAEIDLTEIEAQVEQARELAAKARRDLERGERLHADEVISLEQLQDLRTQAALRRAQLASAEFNLAHAVIAAPGDGIVLRRLAEERELVSAGQPVLVLGARDGGYVVRAALADREIVQLRLGDPAEIRMDAWPGRTFPGELVEIAGAADERTGLFSVEVRFDSAPARLASGLVAKLEISPAAARERELTYVPIGAVVEGDGDRASVFVVVDGRARRRDIRVAFFAPEQVALAEGLSPGETVVTEGSLYLEDGEPVEIVADETQVAAGPAGGR